MEHKTLPPALADIKQSHFFPECCSWGWGLQVPPHSSGFWGFKDPHANPIEANEDCAQNSKTAYNFPANFSRRISNVTLFGVYHTKNSSEHWCKGRAERMMSVGLCWSGEDKQRWRMLCISCSSLSKMEPEQSCSHARWRHCRGLSFFGAGNWKNLNITPSLGSLGGSLHSHRELWGGSHRILTLGELTAAVTAHRCSCRYKMALQPLSQIFTWANKLLDGFLCFPVLADCCGQSVGAALEESNWGMINSLLSGSEKENH